MRITFILGIVCVFNFCVVAQFKEGNYYQRDGTKVTGLIRFNYGGGGLGLDTSAGACSISYRSNKEDKKIELTTNDICCFVIEKDSFAIIKNFKLNAFANFSQDFAQVLQTGPISVYKYYATKQANYMSPAVTFTVFVIEKNGVTDRLTDKKFKELMPVYLVDYPELLQKIKKEKWMKENSPRIARLYNEYKKTGIVKLY